MKTKNVKVALEGFGSYLGMEKGSFVVKNDRSISVLFRLRRSLVSVMVYVRLLVALILLLGSLIFVLFV